MVARDKHTPQKAGPNTKSDVEVTDEIGCAHRTFECSVGYQSSFERKVSEIDDEDARARYQMEANHNKPQSKEFPIASQSSFDKEILAWKHDDPENPYNWSRRKKVWIVLLGISTVTNSTMGSAIPSNAIKFITAEFNIHSTTLSVLPISIYLIGYVVGPLMFGPLSETYGRKWIMIGTYLTLMVFTMACAVAPTWNSLLIFRFFSGIGASAPIAVIGGVYADLYNDPVDRGRANAYFMGATTLGPVFAPIISGFASPALGWRWAFWIALIIAAVCLPPLLFLPETFGPILLSRRAAALRRSTPGLNIFAPQDLEKQGFKQLATVTLTRPIRMVFFEPIVSATCAYLSLCYSIFYMLFQAFPLVYQGIYHFSPGISALMFLPIGVGAFIATFGFIYYDNVLQRAKDANKPWTEKEEARRLPLAFIGGPCIVIALFWLGWSARADVHWAVPFLAGIPFGMGFLLIFMALLNYLADAYEIFAASAMAAASCCRSICGAVLPLAAGKMYGTLGIAWASSLLGFLALGMCGIPILFWVFGEKIRRGSRFCIYLKEKREKKQQEERRGRDGVEGDCSEKGKDGDRVQSIISGIH